MASGVDTRHREHDSFLPSGAGTRRAGVFSPWPGNDDNGSSRNRTVRSYGSPPKCRASVGAAVPEARRVCESPRGSSDQLMPRSAACRHRHWPAGPSAGPACSVPSSSDKSSRVRQGGHAVHRRIPSARVSGTATCRQVAPAHSTEPQAAPMAARVTRVATLSACLTAAQRYAIVYPNPLYKTGRPIPLPPALRP